jgi:magnesium chelatase family protein
MDLLVDVRRPTNDELGAGPRTSSAAALARVTEARERQRRRLQDTSASCNGEMDTRAVRATVLLEQRAERELAHAYQYGWLSARGRHRVLRVAQTVADLAGREQVSREDLLLALSLRQRTGTELAQAVAG